MVKQINWMSKKVIWIVVALLILALILVLGYVLTQSSVKQAAKAVDNSKSNSEMANPASVFCEQNGGMLDIRTAADGSQIGYCKKSGKECEEWALYRGECVL